MRTIRFSNRYRNLLIAFAFLLSFSVSVSAQQDDIAWDLHNINHVFRMAYTNYVDSVDAKKLAEKAMISILKELDPYSVYIPPQQKKANDESYRGHFDGVGIQFSIIKDTITVISALSGGPSKELGILPGDKIVKIDSTDAVKLTNEDVLRMLKGPKGTKVSVHIKREGEPEILFFEITRDKIPLYSVDGAIIIDGTDIGYITLNRFIATTHREFVDSLRKLRSLGMKRLILDIRGNPGGYMDQAISIADEFISAGNEIVSTKGRNSAFNQSTLATIRGEFIDIPLVLLIDGGSASASEIVAGAIQDLDRGLIVGETSFGKGLVQRQYDLEGGAAFRITTSKYYTPAGRCIQRPYEDEQRWRDKTDRLDLKEGANIDHELEKYEKMQGGDSLPPIFKTRKGRNVLGAGGISPDYIVKYDKLSELFQSLRSKNIFFRFSTNYLKENRKKLEKKYKANFTSFLREFDLSNDDINNLKDMALKSDIEWNDEVFSKEEKQIKTLIKASIARSLWDNNEYQAVFITNSKHIQKAIELFPIAEDFIKK